MKKNFKKILIVSICFLLLLIANIYFRKEYDNWNHNHSSFIIYGKEDHQDMLKNTKKIKSYRQALSFETGLDNDVIYDPKVVGTPEGGLQYADGVPDETKLNWRHLRVENDIILAYKASTCDLELSEEEVVLQIHGQNKKYISNFLNQEITFKFNNKEIPLKIKQLANPKSTTHICISDELYNELIKEEKNYIYDIETINHKTSKKLKEEWIGLENNDFYNVILSEGDGTLEGTNKSMRLSDIVGYLDLANVIFAVILVIIIICSIVKFLNNKLNEDEK